MDVSHSNQKLMRSSFVVFGIVLLLLCYLPERVSFMSFKAGFSPVGRYLHKQARFHGTNNGGVSRAAKLLPGDIGGVRTAAEEIRNGRLVAFPTETVYGLGANAFNAEAVQAIFTTKQRPNSDPLIVHVSNPLMMAKLFDFQDAANAANVCRKLANKFWPGPLTIIFKAQLEVPSVITAGTGYVGVRCPKHQVALALIHEANVPIAAPSANRFGHVSPTTAAHVMDDLGHADISILSDNAALTGGCSIGVESTVCRIAKDGRQVSVLRCGAVTVGMLQEALGEGCEVVLDNERHLTRPTTSSVVVAGTTTQSSDAVEAPVAPGQMLKHYAPDLPTYIVRDAASYISTNANSNTPIQTAMVIDFAGQLSPLQHHCKHYIDLSSAGSAEEACFKLFDVLRSSESAEVGNMGVTHVLLPDLSTVLNDDKGSGSGGKDGLLSALWERLHRAASGEFV